MRISPDCPQICGKNPGSPLTKAEGLRYIDLAAAVRGEDGSLPEDLHIGDGYHLNSEAHGLVLDYIRTHAYR